MASRWPQIKRPILPTGSRRMTIDVLPHVFFDSILVIRRGEGCRRGAWLKSRATPKATPKKVDLGALVVFRNIGLNMSVELCWTSNGALRIRGV